MLLESKLCALLWFMVYNLILVHGQFCPPIVCESHTLSCGAPTFFTDSHSQTICRGCNLCIKPGSPLDSNGCPLMQCQGPFPKTMCQNPRYYTSWVVYNNRKCPTCWATICKMNSA